MPFCYPPTPPKDALLLGNMTPTIQKLETNCDKLVKVESALSPDSSENDSRNLNKEISEDERLQRKFYNDSLEDEIDNEQSEEDEDAEFNELNNNNNKSNVSIDEECNDDDDDETCSLKSNGYYDWNKIPSNEWQKSYVGKSELLDTSNTKTNGSKKKAIPGLFFKC